MELTPRRRHVISTVLALVLALESVTAVAAVAAARTTVSPRSTHPLPEASPAGLVLSESSIAGLGATEFGAAGLGATGNATFAPTDDIPSRADVSDASDASDAATTAPSPTPPARAAMPERAARAIAPSSSKARAKSTGSYARSAAHSGRNHLWIPALGINRSISLFPCNRNRPPDNLVYRWGCAGANNIYLMGHAYSVFKPLHDAYVSGRLEVGTKAFYADGKGRVHVFAVRWWKTTRPTPDARWAWASQSSSSMTLQTCVGANSEYRLIVHLVEVDG